jgi:hypothetical protein
MQLFLCRLRKDSLMPASCLTCITTSALSPHLLSCWTHALPLLLWVVLLVFLAGHAHFRTSLTFRYPGRWMPSFEPEASVHHKEVERIIEEMRGREKGCSSKVPQEDKSPSAERSGQEA